MKKKLTGIILILIIGVLIMTYIKLNQAKSFDEMINNIQKIEHINMAYSYSKQSNAQFIMLNEVREKAVIELLQKYQYDHQDIRYYPDDAFERVYISICGRNDKNALTWNTFIFYQSGNIQFIGGKRGENYRIPNAMRGNELYDQLIELNFREAGNENPK